MAADDPLSWLVLVYRVPSEPTRLRATVWRRLRTLGAVYLQNAVAIMPQTPAAERALRKLQFEIAEMGGTATLMLSRTLGPDTEIVEQFRSARDTEYDEILDKCRDFHAGLEKEYQAEHFTFGELEENDVELAKLTGWFEKVSARDSFGGSLREQTAQELARCRSALEAYATRVYESGGDQA